MVRGGLRVWLGLKVMTVMAAVHLALMASSQIKVMGQDMFKDPPPSPPTNPAAPESSSTYSPLSFSASTSSSLHTAPYLSSSSGSSSILDMATSAFKDVTYKTTAAATEAFLGTGKSSPRALKWAIFTPPKPFAKAPHQLVALRSWLNLRVPPQVFLIEADDLDPVELAEIRREYKVESFPGTTNADGFLLQNALFERASMEQDLDVVVVINSDIILGDDFVEALEHAEATFDRFLMVGARYDNLVSHEIPVGADAEWIKAFRDRTWEEGALHTYGGSDYFAWRPVGDPALAAIGGRIPPFTYGRGKADNWIIDMAVRNGVVEVIDATTAIFAVHPAHGYEVAGAAAAEEGEELPMVESSSNNKDNKSNNRPPLLPASGSDVMETERERELDRQLQRPSKPVADAAAPAAATTTAPVTHAPAAATPVETSTQKHRRLAAAAAPATTTSTTTVAPPDGAPGKYVNHWSAKAAGDPQADMNKYLAYTFGSFENGDGTPLHAPWQLMRCVEADTKRRGGGGRGGYVEKPCLRYRARPAACPCEHSPMVPRTLTDVETQGKAKMCGKVPQTLRESFEEDFAFENLMSQQAQEGTVVLIGFNYGYQDMLRNMVCRLQQLDVPNYVIAAFDAEAMAFCRQEVLPCFPVSAEIAAKAEALVMNADEEADERTGTAAAMTATEAPAHVDLQAAAHAFGTKGFRSLTKLKSQQVLRILELGYNVLWSDVDIFWKINPIPGVLAEMSEGEGVDIAIQSNAPPEEEAENGRRRINSGFYLAKSNPPTVEAFRQIVEHARASTLSEQPSFYTVLCGDKLEYVSGKADCVNTVIPVKTRLLSRQAYPNGAMVDVVRGVTPTTADDVAIVHFNWLEGHDAKVESFVNASMWLLQEDERTCKYDGGMGERRRGMKASKTVLLPPQLPADAVAQPPRSLRRHG